MKVTFIGTGSMGQMLVTAFIERGALQQRDVTIYNRTAEKMIPLTNIYREITMATDIPSAIQEADTIFICVKPHDYRTVLEQLQHQVTKTQVVVSITSAVMIEQLEQWLPCKIVKIIPSMTNLLGGGSILCMFGSDIEAHVRSSIWKLFASISTPIEIEEQYTRIGSDLSSCGPAFVSLFIQKWLDAVAQLTGLSVQQASPIAAAMLIGTGLLLTDGNLTTEQIQARISVRGGITEKALQLLNDEFDGTFFKLIHVTHTKFNEDVAKVKWLLENKEAHGS